MLRQCALTVLIALIGFAGSGCSRQTSVPISDVAYAKQVTEIVLDAWKAGNSMDDLKSEVPSIVASDDLWRSKVPLNSYRIQGDGEMFGSNVRFKIFVNYTDKGGKRVERSFNYLVTTVPVVTFFREEG